jgi:NADPH-dependent 2,4-dienoyl-CoA reductase/sulfur reductase-like enzyme
MLATGAQERPTPLEGWTIPGVMTVGSAQILLKTSSQIPSDAVWIAGSGPLPLLYMNQLLQSGGKIAGYLDTSPRGAFRRALPRIVGAIRGDWRGLLQGLGWNLRLRLASVAVWRNVSELAAYGNESNHRLEAISFRDAAGRIRRMAASVFLVHEGLIPQTDITRSLGCDHEWISEQRSFAPRLDDLGATSVPNIFVAGDGAGIAGADAAVIRGQLAAIGIIQKLIPARLSEPDRWVHDVDVLRNKLKRLGQRHHFLNALFPPPQGPVNVDDDVLICRCEEVRAGTLRAAFTEFPDGGPDEIKIRTRCGMGACQGRQCGDALTQMFAAAHGRTVSDVGLFRSRPPVRPITLSELADLDACRQNPPEWEGKSDGPV